MVERRAKRIKEKRRKRGLSIKVNMAAENKKEKKKCFDNSFSLSLFQSLSLRMASRSLLPELSLNFQGKELLLPYYSMSKTSLLLFVDLQA